MEERMLKILEDGIEGQKQNCEAVKRKLIQSVENVKHAAETLIESNKSFMEVLKTASDEIKDIVLKAEVDKCTWDLIGSSCKGLAFVGIGILGALYIAGMGGAAV